MDKPTLYNLSFMSDDRPPVTREDRIAALLREDADVKSQIERLNNKRADLKALLKEMGEDAFERWFFQEHGEDMPSFVGRKQSAWNVGPRLRSGSGG
jgi:hypothetical protein